MGERLNRKETFLIGSLLFGLFFGAGNLIFPVLLGQLAGSNMPQATFVFLLRGVFEKNSLRVILNALHIFSSVEIVGWLFFWNIELSDE